jgi:ATP-dependent exoDNAse (exonuclease V) beta subunit
LFYVAMTRAQERLYISSVAKPGQRLSAFADDLLSNAVVAARDIERILYFESFVVIDPGDTPLKKKQLLSDDEYLQADH